MDSAYRRELLTSNPTPLQHRMKTIKVDNLTTNYLRLRVWRRGGFIRNFVLGPVGVYALSFGVGTQARAQAPADSVSALNRTGHWLEAVAYSTAFLDSSAISSKTERCRVREGQIYAWMRLQERDSAHAHLLTFDSDCPPEIVGPDLLREISQIRNDFSESGVSQMPRAQAEAQNTTTGHRFWKKSTPERLGLNTRALKAHLNMCRRTGADACVVTYGRTIVQEWYSPRYTEPTYAMSSTKSVVGLLVGMLVADKEDPQHRSTRLRIHQFLVWRISRTGLDQTSLNYDIGAPAYARFQCGVCRR
jgi:hypothetical protein